jgi:hypothetical protein
MAKKREIKLFGRGRKERKKCLTNLGLLSRKRIGIS